MLTVSKITIYVNDQMKAKEFWTGKMNFKVSFEAQVGPNMAWLEVAPDGGGTTFVLYDKNMMKMQSPATNVGHPSVILSTDNIEKLHAELKAKQVEVTDLMHMPYGTMFDFKDNENNRYTIREDK